MKILHIAGKLDPRLGGVATAVRTIVRGLEELGLYNEVVSLDDPAAAFIAGDSLVLHTPGEGKTSWYYSPGLIPWLKANYARFDVVVVHGLWQFQGYAVQKLFRELLKKDAGKLPAWFVMPHGMLDPYFQSVQGRKVKALRNWLYWKLIEKNFINNCDGVLFTCLEEQRLARLPFSPYKPRHEAVAGLGVQEPPEYTAAMKNTFLQQCPAVKNKAYLLFLGRIDSKKGVDLLINAYATLTASQQGHTAVPLLVIAGPGLDTEYGRKIKQLVDSSDLLRNAVFFTDMLSGDAKWGAFYCAEAFVLPSHQENFGIALVEAMACEKPVLISNKVNIWQEVVQSNSGLVEEDSAEGTLQLLTKWVSISAEDRVVMTVNARQAFEKQFSVNMAARQFLKALALNDEPETVNEYLYN